MTHTRTHPAGRSRVLVPALIGWGVTAAALHVASGADQMVWVSSTTLIILLAGTLLKNRYARTALQSCGLTGAVVLIIGVALIAGNEAKQSSILETAQARHQATELQIITTSYPRTVSGGREVSWVLAELRGPKPHAPLLMFLNEAPPPWPLGTELTVTASVKAAAHTERHAAIISVQRWQRTDPPHTPFSALINPVTEWAMMLRNGIETQSQHYPGAELVPGLAVGATNGVPDTLTQQLTDVSLTHLTAVSGANCALVTGGVLSAMSWCGAGRRLRLVVAAGALLGFTVVVGPDASLQRAALMSAVILISQFSGQPGSAYPALGVAIITLLLTNPWQAISPGFALSVAATLAILLGARSTTKWLRRTMKIPAVIAVPLAVTLIAQLACSPILLLLQPGISLTSVIANLIAAPAAPAATLLGLIATVLIPYAPSIAEVVLLLASFPARWIAATAQVIAGLQIPPLSWPQGWAGTALFMLACLPIMAGYALRSGTLTVPRGQRILPRQPWQKRPALPLQTRRAAAAGIAFGISLIAAVTVATPIATGLVTPNNWIAVACDVGQGDAFLIRNPNNPNETLLLDTGDQPKQLQDCLNTFHVDTLTLLMLSHDDRDHVGALPHIAPIVQRALIAPPTTEQLKNGRPVEDTLTNHHIPYDIGAAGQTLSPTPGIDIEILAPAAQQHISDANEASLIIMLTIADTRILLLGDTGASEQHELLAQHQNLTADIVKVAHHGSRDQDTALAAEVQADWALISVGASNTYGHPNQQTIDNYQASGSVVLRTDTQGSIALVPISSGRDREEPRGSAGAQLQPWLARPRETEFRSE